jgi:DNA-binding transcriptional LysR family regulator
MMFCDVLSGMTMDLSLLPTFLVFAETRNLTETGRRCGLTQPAVHGQLQRLADSVDAPLYVRDGRRLVLTERGHALAITARRILAHRDAFLHGPGPVRLVAGRGVWTRVLPAYGSWIRAEALQPVVADGPRAEAAVHEGRAELGVTVAPDPERFDHHPLQTVGTVVLAPPGQDPADLSRARWILPAHGRPHRLAMEAWLADRDLPIRVAATCDDWDVMVEWVALGIGWAAVNSHVPSGDLPRHALVDGPSRTYALFWRAGSPPDAAARLISDTSGRSRHHCR